MLGPSLPEPFSKLLSGLGHRPCREALSYTSHPHPAGPPFTPSAQKLHCPLAPDSEAHWPLVSQMPTSDLGFRGHPKHPRRLGWRVCSNNPKFCVIQQPQEAQAPQNPRGCRSGPEAPQVEDGGASQNSGEGEPVHFTLPQSLPKPQGMRGLY